MTYQELVKKVSKALTAADASGISEHVAVQVNVTGEAEGWFYIEVSGGKMAVEPYTYDDKDACMTVSGEDMLALSEGKLAVEQGLSEGRLLVDGNYDKFMMLSAVFAQMPVKKSRKPAAKKTADAPAKKTAAKKPAAKKTAAKKAADEAETFVAPIAEEAAPAKRKCGRPKKSETAAKAAEKKPAAKKTAKKTEEKA